MKRTLVSYLLSSLIVVLLLSACSGTEDRKTKYFNRGMDLYEQGNYVKARLEFKNVLQIDPKDVQAYYMSAQIEEKEENWRKAYALFLRTVELDPKHAEAQVHLGRLYALGGQPEKALEAAEAALDIDPADSTALALRGLARLRMGEKESAISEFEAALKVDPKNLDALSLLSALYADQKQMDKAIALAKKGLEQNPDRMASHLLLASLYEKVGNSEGALEILNKIVQLKPDELQHRIRLVSYYLGKNKPSEAEQVLEQAVNELPDNADAKLALVALLNKQGDKAQAEAALKQFVAQSPETYPLQLGLATLYASTDRTEEAKAILQKVIEQADRSTDGVTARVTLAKLLLTEKLIDQALVVVEATLKIDPKEKEALLLRAAISLENDDPASSIADLRTLLKEDPGYVKAYRLKARVHLKKKEIALARQSLEDAIKVRPQEAAANYELVELLLKTGKLDDAVAVLMKMQRFAPDNLKVLQALAKIHVQQKSWGEVEKIGAELKTKHPGNALGYYYSGLAQQSAGHHVEAIAEFERSLKLMPKAAEPLIALAKSQLAIDQPDAALQRVQMVIDANPEHFLALNLKGEILLAQKQYGDAEASFNRAIEIQPKWATPYKNLIKIKVQEGDDTQTLSLLKMGYEKTQDPLLGLGLGSRYEQAGRIEEAKLVYEKLLEQRPEFSVAANNLAMLLLRGEPEQASLDKALELVKAFEISDNPLYLDTLGWTHLKRGELEKAASVLERAARAKPSIPEIDYHLGLAYHKLGRTADAKEKLELATASDAQFEGLAEAKALLDKLQ
ncbi:MAG: tetratricopeptide repeat protein [Pseudomonadota bacterium]